MARDSGQLSASAGPGSPRRKPRCKRLAYRWSSALALVAAIGAALFLAIPSGSKREPLPGSHLDDPELALAVLAALSPPADGPDPKPKEIVEQLTDLGAAALPLEIAILCGEFTMPEFVPGTIDRPIHPLALEKRFEFLQTVLRALPPKDVVAALRRYAEPTTPLDVRLVLVRLLGEVDASDALGAVLDLATAIEPVHLQRPYVLSQLESALGRRIEHATQVAGRLRSAFGKLDPTLWPVLARATARAGSPEAASFLVYVLGRDDELDVVAMRSLSELSERIGALLSESEVDDLRRLLGHADPRVQRTALIVLGRLRDRPSALLWIDALASEDELVAGAARNALRTLAASELGADPIAWEAWLEREEAWWEASADALDEQLISEDPGHAFDAVSSLLAHPAFTREAGIAFAELVLDPDPTIASAAIEALPRLGAPFALAGLVRALDREDELRDRAHEALRGLVGFDLPADPAAWREAFGFPAE
ncbi:MAG: hypothetical protein IT453_07820 [Planctomycetes bacterium]|nr:hypothetical protein [Planctomycetota bacterium]